MVAISVVYDVKPGNMDAVLAALTRMKAQVLANEPGCSIFQVSRVRGQDNRLILYEVYRDDETLEAHGATAHFEAIIKAEVIPMLEKRERTTLDVVVA